MHPTGTAPSTLPPTHDQLRMRIAELEEEMAANRVVLDEMTTIVAEQTRRARTLEAALRKAQSAIALCFSEGGVITAGDDTPWWSGLIEAQQEIAATLRK